MSQRAQFAPQRVYEMLEINQPVRVERGGDPSVSLNIDGKTGRAIGFSHSMQGAFRVPTVHVQFDDRRIRPEWVVRWHVFAIPETFNEKLKRQIRTRMKAWLA